MQTSIGKVRITNSQHHLSSPNNFIRKTFIFNRSFSWKSTNSTSTEFPFQTIGSAIVERIPVICRIPEKWHSDYLTMNWNNFVDERNLQSEADKKHLEKVLEELQTKEKAKTKVKKEKGKKNEQKNNRRIDSN